MIVRCVQYEGVLSGFGVVLCDGHALGYLEHCQGTDFSSIVGAIKALARIMCKPGNRHRRMIARVFHLLYSFRYAFPLCAGLQ